MLRIAKWAAPVVALGLLLTFAISARAEDKAKGTVSGTVLDKDGKAVTGAKVRLYNADDRKHKDKEQAADADTNKNKTENPGTEKPKKDKPAPVAEAATDSDGKFTMNDVPVGNYVAVARLKDKGTGNAKVEVKSGETASVEIKLGEVMHGKK